MRSYAIRLIAALLAALSLIACDKAPMGVMSTNEMADLIADMHIAEAYISSHPDDFPDDSTKLVLKQSVFKKHGITREEYDSSLVWYAHNMENYSKAYDKALGILKNRLEKLNGGEMAVPGREGPQDIMASARLDEQVDNNATPQEMSAPGGKRPGDRKTAVHGKLSTDAKSDTTNLWKNKTCYALTQGAQRGFITFDVQPDAQYKRGDRYQLAYRLTRGGNEFKVSLNIDYTDGGTAQITRSTHSDGWVTIDVQSDTARQVRRIYGYLSYDMKRKGAAAYVDSISLVRTHLNPNNYGLIHAQRQFERTK